MQHGIAWGVDISDVRHYVWKLMVYVQNTSYFNTCCHITSFIWYAGERLMKYESNLKTLLIKYSRNPSLNTIISNKTLYLCILQQLRHVYSHNKSEMNN